MICPPAALDEVRSILARHVPGYTVSAFGSRVTSAAKPTSDLDLCIVGNAALPPGRLDMLAIAFQESWLPMKVDVVEWAKLGLQFREVSGGGGNRTRVL